VHISHNMQHSEPVTSSFPFFKKSFPKNFLLESAAKGAFILFAFCFLFGWIYQPLNIHPSALLNFEGTLLVYAFVIGLTSFMCIKLLSNISFFSGDGSWNLTKEVSMILIVLFMIGNVVYFAAFILEVQADRWNIPTYLDSLVSVFLICSIPFGIGTLMNFNTLFQDTINLSPKNQNSEEISQPDILKLETSLKKDELSIPVSKLLYAESDGNYVFFHIHTPKGTKREMARVPMNQVEEQLSGYAQFFRTHRSFMVNMNYVTSATGNALGYTLKLQHTEKEIPVSRTQAKAFKQLYTTFG